MTFDHASYAFLPALCFVGVHLIEANLVTPMVVGRRLTINPLMILLALSFWAWVWGTTGALLAVPLLIILRTVFDAAGKPDIAGFLFEEGTLIHDPDERGRAAGRLARRGTGDRKLVRGLLDSLGRLHYLARLTSTRV